MRSAVRPILLMGLLVLATPLRAAEAPVLAILPFEIKSPQRLDYLQETLMHLVADQIAESGGVSVVPPRKVMESLEGRSSRVLPDKEARDLGRSLRADYVLSGRFTTVGEGFRVEVRMLDVASDREMESVVVDGDRLASLRPKVGELASALAKHFPAMARPSTASAPPVIPSMPTVSPAASWISRRLPIEIRGIGIGDVDGDGSNEIVVLGKHEVVVFRRSANDLTQVASYSVSSGLDLIAVDVADLNRNGTAEIYVTAGTASNGLASFVLEWVRGELRQIERIPWYFRVADLPGGPTLVGQRRSRERAFDGPIRQLLWQGGKLVPGNDLNLPGHVTVYSFAVADLDGDGQPEIISLQPRTQLLLYHANGDIAARGDTYGQTKLYLVAKAASSNDGLEEGVYLPGRVRAIQVPGQGPRLLVSRNHEVFGALDRLRIFRNGEVVGLRWQRADVEEIGQTQRFGYVADFQVGTLDRGRDPMLVVGSVTSFDGVIGSAGSYVALIPLRAAFGR